MMRPLLIVMLVAGVVAAQPSGDRAKAASHFKQGQEHFKAGDYDRAIAEYETAYTLSKEPVLIFNIGLCHDRAKRPGKALEAFQHYLELAPNGEVADEAREDVARLMRVVDELEREAKQQRDAEATLRAKEAHDAEVAAQAKRDREAADREHHRAAIEAQAQPIEHRSTLEHVGAYATGALAIVSLGLAAKFGLDARSAAGDITNHRGPWTDAVLARDADGRSAQTNAIIFGSIAGGTAIASGVLYLLHRSNASSVHDLRLEIAPARGGASASVGGAF
jgi:tetratricopeptide (TPR) repeat protein